MWRQALGIAGVGLGLTALSSCAASAIDEDRSAATATPDGSAGADDASARDGAASAPMDAQVARPPKGDGADAAGPSDAAIGADAGTPRTDASGPPPDVLDGGTTPVPTQDASMQPTARRCAVPPEAQAEDVSQPTTVVGNGTPESCTASAFVAAVARGGVVTFSCGPNPITITLDQTAKVFNDKGQKVVIDGGGKVTLSGGGKIRILYQSTCDERQAWTTSHCDNQDFPQLTVQNLSFIDGRSSRPGDGGGAIYAQGGRLKIVNCRFSGNVCGEATSSAGGGAVRAFQQSLGQPVYVVDSTFGESPERGNSCTNGGALSGISVPFRVLNSTFRYNRAIGSGAASSGSGGALYAVGVGYDVSFCGSTLEQNTAIEGGGAIFFVSDGGSLDLTDSSLRDNPSGKFESSPGVFVRGAGERPNGS